MTNRINEMLQFILDKKHHQFRRKLSEESIRTIESTVRNPDDSFIKRAVKRLVLILDMEVAIILPGERISFLRTIGSFPDIYSGYEWDLLKKEYFIHEHGKVCNISSDYASVISTGLEVRKQEALRSLERCGREGDWQAVEFLECVVETIDAVERISQRYADAAERSENYDTARILRKVPMRGAETFAEALQSFRVLHYTLWCAGNYHNTVGRFDRYMYPYFKADMDAKRLDRDSALELVEEFFITFNRDSDLYPGMQQGDNGQSIVLGGIDENGNDVFNELSELCLLASLELKLIDPKINLRIHKNTPMKVYELGTWLTKEGLGFPQYSNDDVVIPGLLKKGYELEDARNYVVAACWEFIIPGVGMDIPNIGAVSLAGVTSRCIREGLAGCANFETFFSYVKDELGKEVESIIRSCTDIYMEPAPFQSVLMKGCMENARDISKGLKYNNYGIHGTGLSTAVDSLAALKKYVFDEKRITADELLKALENNFEGYDELHGMLKFDAPKMGNDDDYADNIASGLLDAFAGSLEGKVNERGGCYRAGTGSAMYYLWHSQNLGATPDGRKGGEPISANYSPSLVARIKGPVSVMKSFTKPDITRVMNGGPLTLELHDTMFQTDESINKVAMLVKSFFDLGGHQLQLNAINRDKLFKAQAKPELYRNLIVRVWGWSGYFTELDRQYQDHIIKRMEFTV